MAQKANPISLRLPITRKWDSTWVDPLNTQNALKQDRILRHFALKKLSFLNKANCRNYLLLFPDRTLFNTYFYWNKRKLNSKKNFQSKNYKTKKSFKKTTYFNKILKPQFKIVQHPFPLLRSFNSFSKKLFYLDLNFLSTRKFQFHSHLPFTLTRFNGFQNPFKSANALAYIIAKLLRNRLRTHRVFNFLKKWYKIQKLLIGFKVRLNGRITKSDKASTLTLTCGRIPTNTLNYKIDFCSSNVQLTSGTVGIKVWIAFH